MKKGVVKAKMVAAPSNSGNKKLWDVCIVWDGGTQVSCGFVMAATEAEAKKLGKKLAKKATDNL